MTQIDRLTGLVGGLAIKAPVRAATTANITLSGLQTVDGVALATGDRVLVKAQTSSVNNGIYTADTGTWTRAPDFDGQYDVVQGTIVEVTAGTAGTNTWWRVSTANPIVIETSAITFVAALISDIATLNFLQTGAGAVTRSAQSKMRELISPDDFGAVGDGVTDDTAAVQAAVTAGGLLYLPPNKIYKTTATVNLTSNLGIWGPGKIKCTGACDIFTGTTVSNVWIDGVTFEGTAGYYAVRVKTASIYIRVVNCYCLTISCFASNNINDAYSAQSESTYCKLLQVSGNEGNTATDVTDIGFIVIAYSRDAVVSNNVCNGYRYGIFGWGGNTITQDPIANARKCFRLTISSNDTYGCTGAGQFLLLCQDSQINGGNVEVVAGASADVGTDMESCTRCRISNLIVKSANNGVYTYGVNVDCEFVDCHIECTVAGKYILSNNIAYPPGNDYLGQGTVTMRGCIMKCSAGIVSFWPGVQNRLVIEGNTFENVTFQGEQSGAQQTWNVLEIVGNKWFYDYTPATAMLVEISGGNNALWTTAKAAPFCRIKNNVFINRTGGTIAKRVLDFEDWRASGSGVVSGNEDYGFGTSLYISATVTAAARVLTVFGNTSDATTQLNRNDITQCTLLIDRWQTPTFAAGSYTGSGSMTWTLASGDVTTMSYRIDGKTMRVHFDLATTTVAGTPDNFLQIVIPEGRTAAKACNVPCGMIADNGTSRAGFAEVAAAGTVIKLRKDLAGTVWTAAADTTRVSGEIAFEIQ